MLLTIFTALAVGASNAPPETHLTWHAFTKNDPVERAMPISFYGLASGVPLPAGYSVPAGFTKAACFMIYRGGDGASIVGVLARSKAAKSYDVLWLDWNGDKKLAESEKATLSTIQDNRYGPEGKVFTFAKTPQGPHGPIRVSVLLVSDQMVSLVPTGCMQGEIDLDGRKTMISLFDSNGNGSFGDSGANGPEDYMQLGSDGMTPVPALMQLGDGKFWEPKVSKDGSKIAFLEDKTPTGVIAFTGPELKTIALTGPKGSVMVAPKDGKVTVPAGAYVMTMASFGVKDESGVDWNYSLTRYNLPKLVVPAGDVLPFEVGGPLSLKVEAQRAGTGYSFSLNLKDKSGSAVQGLYDPKFQRPAEPRLVIKNAQGQVVKTTPFAYG